MTSKNEDIEARIKMATQLHQDLMEERKNGPVDCIITDLEISNDPDDPIRKVVDDVLGDFVEIKTPNGTFFFPTEILRS